MSDLLLPGSTCVALAETRASGLLVDARDYYRAFYDAASNAKHYILLAGWEFDSDVELLRGQDAARARFPVALRAFLTAVCAERPDLSVYILAWDYSLVFALEREWLQRLIFDWTTPRAISFRFDRLHAEGACHHEKLAVIDGRVALAGGIDFARSRWDDRRHEPSNPDRASGDHAHGPYHDCGCFLAGPVADALRDAFAERWRRVTGDHLVLATGDPAEVTLPEGALPLRTARVGLSRTRGAHAGMARVSEIMSLYRRAIAEPEHTIYLETQYFTSRAVRDALLARMRDRTRPKLELAIVISRSADTPKERIALADAQTETLASLVLAGEETGSKVGIYYSAVEHEGAEITTFVHSKLCIIDDRLLSVGSANLTNRSMSLDTELNVSWEAGSEDRGLASDIARVRASLIAEHAGTDTGAPAQGLVDELDRMVLEPTSRLRRQQIAPDALEDERVIRPERIFDPDHSLAETDLLEAVQIPASLLR